MNRIATVIGKNTRRRRIAKRLTQVDLADIVSCHRITITRIESGSMAPGYELLDKLAGALDCTPAQLLANRSTTPKKPRPLTATS